MPRPKTGIERSCKLWPETVAALREAIAGRPETDDDRMANLVFLTKYRKPWYKETADSPVSKEFRKVLDTCRLYRPGRTFYALRHTFETIAGESRDQVAVDHIMGHADQTMAGTNINTHHATRRCHERVIAVIANAAAGTAIVATPSAMNAIQPAVSQSPSSRLQPTAPNNERAAT